MAKPSLYLDELQFYVLDAREKLIPISTLSRTLRKLQISNKSITKEASEQNNTLRATWQASLAEYLGDPSVFVFLDESSVNRFTGQQTNGWAPIGGPCVLRQTFVRGKSFSMLPALTLDGIVALEIFEGSVNCTKFIQFLKEQLVCSLMHSNFCIISKIFVGSNSLPIP